MSKKDKGRKWDGKSRVSTDLYRKRWNEIFKKNDPDQADQPDPNWIKGYNKLKKKNEKK
jgi:hypothetical protein